MDADQARIGGAKRAGAMEATPDMYKDGHARRERRTRPVLRDEKRAVTQPRTEAGATGDGAETLSSARRSGDDMGCGGSPQGGRVKVGLCQIYPSLRGQRTAPFRMTG